MQLEHGLDSSLEFSMKLLGDCLMVKWDRVLDLACGLPDRMKMELETVLKFIGLAMEIAHGIGLMKDCFRIYVEIYIVYLNCCN